MGTTTGSRLTVRNKVGLAMAGLLGMVEFTGPSPAAVAAAFLFPKAEPDNGFSFDPFGPAAIAVIVAALALGVATLAGVVITLTKESRISARVVAAARVISVLLTASVFLVEGLPAWIFLVAAALVIANITAVILVLSRPAAGTDGS